MLLNNIRKRELVFKNLRAIGTAEQAIHLKVDSLILRVAQVLSKYMNELKPFQVN
jgi:hypothetical protein